MTTDIGQGEEDLQEGLAQRGGGALLDPHEKIHATGFTWCLAGDHQHQSPWVLQLNHQFAAHAVGLGCP